MISYEPLFETMKKKKISSYWLIHKIGLPSKTYYQMKNSKDITTKTLDFLCTWLDCEVQDIIKHVKE